ncbi:MAG: hypothetical protein H7239_03540 [Flavobacterium sp.]|nr:hypothetical protein [Flavobacterium sp.]
MINITITGKTRYYTIPITFVSNLDLYVINGSKKLTIKDFERTSTTKMMGIIKVSEWIDIDFHIICKITNDGELVEL